MADAIKVTELPSGAFRVFNRIDTVELIPTAIYDSSEIAEDDRATFKVKAADPVTSDELKEVMLSFPIIQAGVCESNGITIDEMNNGFVEPEERVKATKETKKKREEREHATQVDKIVLSQRIQSRLLAWQQFQQITESAQSTKEVRDLLAKCVTIENYKELDGADTLVASKKKTAQIMQVIPAVFCVWLFNEVRKMSNLTPDEVLGLS